MFDLQRFLRLARVQWAERGREYLWFFGVGIVVHGLVWLLITGAGKSLGHYSRDVQQFVFVSGYLICGVLFAGLHFSALGKRGSALTALMRPASTFEKFLLTVLIVGIAFPIVFSICFQICNVPGALLAEADQLSRSPAYPRATGPFIPFINDEGIEGALFLGLTTLQALVIAGVLYFRRFAWLKTGVAVFVVLFIVIPLLMMLAESNIEILIPGVARSPDEGLFRLWRWVLWIGVPGLLWLSSYFLLRERELQ